MPAGDGDGLRVCGLLDVMLLRPGGFLFGGEAATVPPAVGRRGTTADVTLAGEWLAAVFRPGDGGDREADGGGEVAEQHEGRASPAGGGAPAAYPVRQHSGRA